MIIRCFSHRTLTLSRSTQSTVRVRRFRLRRRRGAIALLILEAAVLACLPSTIPFGRVSICPLPTLSPLPRRIPLVDPVGDALRIPSIRPRRSRIWPWGRLIVWWRVDCLRVGRNCGRQLLARVLLFRNGYFGVYIFWVIFEKLCRFNDGLHCATE